MPLLDLRQARADIGLADVLALLGWTAQARQGLPVRGPCPLHGAASPRSRSFSAHLGKNCWQCFRCRAAGNALELWAQATRQELVAAVLDLYDRLGRTVPWLPPSGGVGPENQRGSPGATRKDGATMHDP